MLKRGLSYFGVCVLYALSLLPLPLLYLFATVIYWILYDLTGYRRAVVKNNLSNAFPEKSAAEISQIEKEYYKYLSALIFEIIKLSTISKSEIQRRFKFTNTALINDYLTRGESVLVCSAHYGNWEMGIVAVGLAIKVHSYPIYKPLSNKIFDQWFHHIRSRFGNRMISMRQTFRALSETKDEPTVFYFGSDQAPPKEESHYWINFLNQQTSIPMGLEKIAIKTKRPVFYIKVKRIKKGYYEGEFVPVALHPEKTTGHEITDLHARILEESIQADPAYWLWSHKRWKHQPTP